MTLALAETAGACIGGGDAEMMTVDPLSEGDWDALVAAHPERTIFHVAGWARVLRDTYGHRPFYFARFEGRQLAALLPMMEVSSRLTGRRGVALPFTDFCPPLLSVNTDGEQLYQEALQCGRQRGWKYLECRSLDNAWPGSRPSISFYGHSIDLTVGQPSLFQKMEAPARRAVRKAEREGVEIDFDSGEQSMRNFFYLHCATRRRHGLPPQPWRFFSNIQRHLLSAGLGFLATARVAKRAVAAAVFLHEGRQALYKFGASDYAYQALRPNNLTMWAAINHCAQKGLAILHLGRTSLSNAGLRRFKLGLGAEEQKIHYTKYDFASQQFVSDVDRVEGWFNRVFSRLPLPLLRLSGAILYPHLS
jgi:CelD/BcsL family acetyltransferase involved in cellulose biosynthesis